MRVVLGSFLLLVLLGGLGFAAPPCRALAAEASSSLQSRIDAFEDLKKDETLSKRRDSWLALEERFASLAKNSQGEKAAKAAYYVALTREELGRRSFLAADHREAAALFAAVAEKRSDSPFVPAALYRQALILRDRLQETDKSASILERLCKRYPKAPEAAKAAELLSQIRPAERAGDPPSTSEAASSQSDSTASFKSDATSSSKNDAEPSSVTIKNIVWKGREQRAVITLELDAAAKYSYEFVPPNAARKTPARIQLDIAEAFPSRKIKPGITLQSLTVSRIRTAQSGDGTRITFDCDGLRCFAVRTPANAPKTIQIEVSRKADIKDGVPVTAKGELQAQNAKKVPAEDSLMEQLGLTVRTIMIDAGHGGKDPGAMHRNFVEKQFTLAMARRVGALLQKKGFTVLYTRGNNKYVSLQDRPDIANTKKADLFISIHINANPSADIRGLETYYLDVAKTQSAATVAARENAVSVKNISDLQVILTDLMLSSKLEESHELARMVHKGILSRVRRANFATPDHGVRSAPFYVLMGARMPAILVEFGYITNPEDAKLLASDAFLQKQAEGLVEGIVAYKAQLAKVARR